MTGARVTIYTSSEWRRDNRDFVCLLQGWVVVVGWGVWGERGEGAGGRSVASAAGSELKGRQPETELLQ